MPRDEWAGFVRGQLQATGMTYTQLAGALGIAPQYVLDWINDAPRAGAQPALVVRATARALGVPTSSALSAAGYPA
ncbi:helix-turn-helix transcriptional regulator [Rhodococcus sp. HNM0569]|uniref:helix-turn-helix domain-containing protein n=1 Tax=Rhodococcus sp. HNM0569 TaxID=2716340 RepID=UPI00146CB168|nr:helix-turn-helix transcriptional regulator [Rhodococcus sp. HNM0569]NLU81756.1 helix-turn-helix transcriptional regulator [Rhodococcus sp. HNM0569]